MLRAEQLALIQGANQQLLNIRELELDYFTSVFENFGIISGLLSGFALSCVTQVDAINADAWEPMKWTFWIFCTLVMCTSLHCLLTCTFCNVFGVGLALRGPSGSMVRAVDGMIKEKDAIFVSLIATIVGFQLMSLAAGWMVMYQNAAIVCSIINILGMYYWYTYCLRIYNRFKIHKVQTAWQEGEDGPTVAKSSNPLLEEPLADDELSTGSSGSNGGKKKKSMMSRLGLGFRKGAESGVGKEQSSYSPPKPTESNKNRMDGYLTFKESKKGKIFSSEAWTRQYFVVDGSDLFYYRKKEDYLLNPGKSVKNRPLSLEGYVMSTNVAGDGTYEILLTPEDDDDERKGWSFRCDTAEEMQAWSDCFTDALSAEK